jgi:hypothetical protein
VRKPLLLLEGRKQGKRDKGEGFRKEAEVILQLLQISRKMEGIVQF